MLSTAAITTLFSAYDLGPPLQVSHARHGYVNETAFVTTRYGRVVVRRCHAKLGVGAAEYRHGLMAHVRNAGVAVPEVIRNRDGKTVTMLDGRVWEVQEFIAGDDFTPGCMAQAYSVGQLLAEYHSAIAGFPPPAGEPPPPRYAPRAMRGLSERILERDMFGELHEMLAWYDGRAHALEQALPDDVRANMPQIVIHGDLHPDNLRFRGEEAVALLDFDQTCRDSALVDLVDALVACATTTQRDQRWMWGVFAGPLDSQCSHALIEGYTQIVPLSPTELGIVPVLLESLWLYGALARVATTPEGAPDYHLGVLQQGQALSTWLQCSHLCAR